MQIRGYMPGSIGRMVELHGRYYARDWRFGPYFEAKIANEIEELLARLDPKRDGFWIAAEEDEIVALWIEACEKLPKLISNLRFEVRPETPIAGVIAAVQLDHAADASRHISSDLH